LRDIEDADDGVIENADMVVQERLAGGGFGEAFVGVVSRASACCRLVQSTTSLARYWRRCSSWIRSWRAHHLRRPDPLPHRRAASPSW
jgi:hypothetical protein